MGVCGVPPEKCLKTKRYSLCHFALAPNNRSEKYASRPVSRVLSAQTHGMTIHLGRLLSNASCDQPGRQPGNRSGACAPCHPYSVLLPVGFAVPLLLPGARCALTAPFHPCPRRAQGGLLSVALSLGLPPPGVTRHRISMEPGLSSPPVNTHRYSCRAVIQPAGTLKVRNTAC